MSARVLVLIQPEAALREWRCPKCRKLLARLRLAPGSVVEIKCGKCNTIAKEAA